ncbi:MAG: L-2-hydroxyglutarate oxidase [Candidatus Sericytochromatia bacterium]
MSNFDVLIIGGGIVGLSTAYNILQKNQNINLLLIEKENSLAYHQTGRNSGVIHSGIYYKPNSLKAINCREGKKLLEEFCKKEDINFEICGKIIVATNQFEVERLNELLYRGEKNGIKCRFIDRDEIKDFEPYVNGEKAIYIEEAGIIDYKEVCLRLSSKIKENKGLISLSEKVEQVKKYDSELVVVTNKSEYHTKNIINCAGLYCDKIAQLSGYPKKDLKIIPFRGEYYELRKDKTYFCKNLIYPVPDLSFPFLGVHFTRMIKGGVECGPNAVLAFAREGYKNTDINFKELFETLSYKGMQKLMLKHWKMELGELWRSFNKKAFTQALNKLIPDIKEDYLIPADAGIRAQAITLDGKLVDDFFIHQEKNIINVLNAPSPAATASLNIGKMISEKYLLTI